jgi:hypothetical protein
MLTSSCSGLSGSSKDTPTMTVIQPQVRA